MGCTPRLKTWLSVRIGGTVQCRGAQADVLSLAGVKPVASAEAYPITPCTNVLLTGALIRFEIGSEILLARSASLAAEAGSAMHASRTEKIVARIAPRQFPQGLAAGDQGGEIARSASPIGETSDNRTEWRLLAIGLWSNMERDLRFGAHTMFVSRAMFEAMRSAKHFFPRSAFPP